MAALRGFASAFKVSLGDVKIGLSEPLRADSGNLEVDLPELLVATAQAAKAADTSVALLIDEVHYLTEDELRGLIVALHRVVQRGLPLILFGAGLPQLAALAGDAKSYAERLFDFPAVAALAPDAAAQGPRITLADVNEATDQARDALDRNFFRVRFDRLTPREQVYLYAMAQLGAGPHRSGAIAEQMQLRVERTGPLRSGLIRKGMIWSPSHGMTAFTVPMFDTFMRRAMG